MKTLSKTGFAISAIALILFALAFRFNEPCALSGKITEKGTKNDVFSAIVILSQNGKQIQTVSSDLHGNFCFIAVPDGNYAVEVKYLDFTSYSVKNIIIKDGRCSPLKIEIQPSTAELQTISITGSKISSPKACESIVYNYGLAGPASGASRFAKYKAYDLALTPSAPAYDLGDDPRPKDKKEEPDGNEDNTEEYNRIVENEFIKPTDKALSTFSIDVDVASYGIMRKKIEQNQKPPKESIRLEELINYFTYDYPDPKDGKPFSVSTEVGECPWNPAHQLLHVGIQGRRMEKTNLPPSNLIFLIDVSGSMQSPDKLPLVKQSLRMLVNELNERDRIAMAVYAGSAGLVLPSTACSQKDKIIEAIDRLEAGGSTAGAAGIKLAYKTAKENFLENGNNRVILCTDGDFNVGISSDADLTSLIEQKRDEGIFLSVLGFGMVNYKDSKMEKLADKGNGNYAYIDNLMEAKKNLVTQMGGTLLTIAKDVKIQVEFNPAKVKAYRLIGYENRALADKDFNDDKKDAGEIGAGVSVTALYEIITDEGDPSYKEIPKTDPLKYQKTDAKSLSQNFAEMMNVKIRYKEPKESTSKLLEFPVKDQVKKIGETSDNFRFASSVASFGMLLRDSKFKGNFTFDRIKQLATGAKGKDIQGYRGEFVKLVGQAS